MTTDYKYIIQFTKSHDLIIDKVLMKTLGLAKLKEDLYYLPHST